VEPSVPRELSDVVMKALERDLGKRFKSARELARVLSTTCGHLLFDAEERADFMRQRFEEKITAAQRLFDVAGSKDDAEVDAAVEDFRRSSAHEREAEPPPRKPHISANKLRAARGGQMSARGLKKVSEEGKRKAQAYKKSHDSTDFEGKPLGVRDGQERVSTEAMVPTVPPPSASKLWPLVAVVFALLVGAVVWKVMQPPPEPPPKRDPVGELPGTDLPGTDLPGTELPGTDLPGTNPTLVKNPQGDPKDPTVRSNPAVKKEQGEVTLALIPEATVTTRSGTKLGQGTLINFSLPVGTHLVTIRGDDGIKRKLSLQVSAGKNKPQRYRLDDLPPE
jgi:hypothetical protein